MMSRVSIQRTTTQDYGHRNYQVKYPAPCRQKIKDALKIIMSGDEKMLNSFIQEFREEFMELPPEEIAYPRSLNGSVKV